MKHHYITLLLLFLSSQAFSQIYSVSGTVQDDDKQPVSLAYVSLYTYDSSIVQNVQADDKGQFKFEKATPGKYILTAQMVGYGKVKRELNVLADIENVFITFNRKSNTIDEVVIKEDRVRFETDLGKTIMNVNKEMKAGKSLLDLLQDMPGVHVSPTGSITIEGKTGITLLVDDKPVHFTGKSLEAYLKGVDAGRVGKIELMTQPSAKYDVEGTAGIIAVKMTKEKEDGMSGSLNGRYSYGRYGFANTNANVNYRHNKTTYHFSPGYYGGKSFLVPKRTATATNANTDEVVSVVEAEGYMLERFSDYSLELAVDHDFSDKVTTGVSVRGLYHPNTERDWLMTDIDDRTTGDKDIINYAVNENGHLRRNIRGNFFLKYEPDTINKVIVNGDVFREKRKIYQHVRNENYGAVTQEALLLNNNIPIETGVYSLKADYTGKVKNIDIEAGVKSSYVPIDEENQFEVYEDGSWENDMSRSNHFLYDEYINAVYVSGSAKKGKWSGNAGVRVENTNATGHELIQDKRFERNYTSLFPTAFVNYKADDKHTIECNYGRRLKRPFYRELNPFTRFSSQYVYSSGNPNLLPMYTHNVELKHNYRGKLITTLSHSVSSGVFTAELLFDNATKVSNYSTTNNGRSARSALTAFFNGELNEWWSITLSGTVYLVHYEGALGNEYRQATGKGYSMNIDTQLSFDNGWYANASMWYASPMLTSITNTYVPTPYFSGEVSKSIIEDSVTIKLSFSDPLGTYRMDEYIDIGNVSSAYEPIYNTQSYALSFSYNFGNKEKARKKRDIALEEAGRM